MSQVDELAKGFVEEYLERTPEYIDVVEYVSENIEDEDDQSDEFHDEVFVKVNAILDTVAQRLADEDE